MRRVNKSERVRIALTLNGRKLAADAESRMLLERFFAPRPRRHRDACRL